MGARPHRSLANISTPLLQIFLKLYWSQKFKILVPTHLENTLKLLVTCGHQLVRPK